MVVSGYTGIILLTSLSIIPVPLVILRNKFYRTFSTMNVLRFVVCFAAVSFHLSLVAAHDEEQKEETAEIGYVKYERTEYDDKIDGGVQLADYFRVDEVFFPRYSCIIRFCFIKT